MKTKGIAYLLWALCLLGVFGIHRFYTGRWVTALIWFFTFGLLGVGQIIDLFLIPGQVRAANLDDELEAIDVERRAKQRVR